MPVMPAMLAMDVAIRSHKKTVCFIGEITVKTDSRGIYSLENINYHDAYLNIPVIAARIASRPGASDAVPRSAPSFSSQFRFSGRFQQSADKAEV